MSLSDQQVSELALSMSPPLSTAGQSQGTRLWSVRVFDPGHSCSATSCKVCQLDAAMLFRWVYGLSVHIFCHLAGRLASHFHLSACKAQVSYCHPKQARFSPKLVQQLLKSLLPSRPEILSFARLLSSRTTLGDSQEANFAAPLKPFDHLVGEVESGWIALWSRAENCSVLADTCERGRTLPYSFE